MQHIFHISNTDIVSDSRIRKEIIALGQVDGNVISVMGLADDSSYGTQVLDDASYFKSPLLSRLLRHFPRPLRYFFELIEFTIRAVRHAGGLQPKPTIVHCHDTFALPAGWLIKKIHRCRLVYDAHELESNKNGQNIILSKATVAIESFCWNGIDLLVSVSDSIIQWYCHKFGTKPSVLVLNSPVYDPDSIERNLERGENYFVKKYQIPEESVIFIYLGILAPGRGIESCIEAFKELNCEAHVVFIGYGRLADLIKDASEKYGNIHYHPPVKHHEVVPLASNGDYGLCLIEDASLSDYLCLPNKLFEYSFAGLRILASNFPEIERTVVQYNLGVCCSPNSVSIKNAILQILQRPLTDAVADISELSWDSQAKKLQNAYASVLYPKHASH